MVSLTWRRIPDNRPRVPEHAKPGPTSVQRRWNAHHLGRPEGGCRSTKEQSRLAANLPAEVHAKGLLESRLGQTRP